MSDPYPFPHPDQPREYDHESLFHSNESDYNQPASVSNPHEEHFISNVQNDDIMQIARSALQNELFADNDVENDVQNDGMGNNNMQNDGMGNDNTQKNSVEDKVQNDGMENDNVQNEQFSVHEVPLESNGALNGVDENNLLWPVRPFESGEGLPYAPIDWPDPGDTWTWRVGRRIAASGFFQDRFLYIPKRLGRQNFASKAAVETYIKSNFPDADVDAFFASFSWKIPGKTVSTTKVQPAPPPSQEEKVGGQEEEKTDTIYSSLRKRRSTAVASSTPAPIEQKEEQSPPTTKRTKRSGSKLSATPKPKPTKQSGGKSSRGPKKGRENKAELSSSTPKKMTKRPTRRSSRSAPVPNEEVVVAEEPVVEPIPEDFDNYLSSLEDILTQPAGATQVNSSTTTDSTAAQSEMAEARSKLSSLLVTDFNSLISPNNITELTTLASKLRKDPTMNAEQLVKLKLIEDIPSFSEVYLESREIIDQVDEFFAALEAKRAKVASLKTEYSDLKEKADQLQSQVDENSMAVDEIDRQIALLRSRRAELTNAIESNKAAKNEVAYTQKLVASAIPKVVHEIQIANTKLPDLELKKTNAVKREAEIRAKFAPLEGFSL